MPNGFAYVPNGSLVSASPGGQGVVVEVDSGMIRMFTDALGGTRLDDGGDFNFSSIATGDVDGGAVLVLSASTPVTLDLSDLSGEAAWVGDDAFARITAAVITNLDETNDLVVGNAASASFQGPLSAAATFAIRPGESFSFRRDDANGYSTSSANSLKIDPGASAGLVGIAIKGASS